MYLTKLNKFNEIFLCLLLLFLNFFINALLKTKIKYFLLTLTIEKVSYS